MKYFESFTISIAKFQKYCKTYCKISKHCTKCCKISKVLQYFVIILESPLCITLRVLLGSCLSEINTHIPLYRYGITPPESEPSSLSSLLFSTFDELKIILEYCGSIRYKISQQLTIVD